MIGLFEGAEVAPSVELAVACDMVGLLVGIYVGCTVGVKESCGMIGAYEKAGSIEGAEVGRSVGV